MCGLEAEQCLGPHSGSVTLGVSLQIFGESYPTPLAPRRH